MVKARVYTFVKQFENVPKETDFQLIEEDLPSPEEGQFVIEAVYLSVDPYMRLFANQIPVGSTMLGMQVAKIIDSKNNKFPIGKYIVGSFGWRTHTLVTQDMLKLTDMSQIVAFYILPDFGDLPLSLGIGMLGMPGNTAYFGFLEICNPKPNETVVVTAAGGAVGSHVGQIAKLTGCKVIGITGSDEKCEWLKSLGFDKTINYKTADLPEALKEAAPQGIDCYFDNVGGEISSIVMQHMNQFGRISVCGFVSAYNDYPNNIPKATIIQPSMIFQQLTIKGFIVGSWGSSWLEGINKNLTWIQEGKLKYKETVTEGFQNMPKAFIGLFSGQNVGKAVVKV